MAYTDKEEAWNGRNVILHANAKNTMKGTCEQEENSKENVNLKNAAALNLKEAENCNNLIMDRKLC